MPRVQLWLAVYGTLSFLALVLYGWDKHRARTQGRRVPEARLHALALLGGFPGAFLGMHLFRHKTRQLRFHAVIVLAALLHVGAWLAVSAAGR